MKSYVLDRIEQLTRPEKIYIIPTREGFFYLFTNIMIIFIGLVYNNNPILIIGFILMTLFLVSMVYTNYNLSGIRIYTPEFVSGFANKQQGFKCRIDNLIDLNRNSINIEIAGNNEIKPTFFLNQIDKTSSIQYEKNLSLSQRGFYKFKRIKIYTTYPLGMFHSWMYFNADLYGHVSPEPSGENLSERQRLALDDDEYIGQKKLNHSIKKKNLKNRTRQLKLWMKSGIKLMPRWKV